MPLPSTLSVILLHFLLLFFLLHLIGTAGDPPTVSPSPTFPITALLAAICRSFINYRPHPLHHRNLGFGSNFEVLCEPYLSSYKNMVADIAASLSKALHCVLSGRTTTTSNACLCCDHDSFSNLNIVSYVNLIFINAPDTLALC